VPRRLTAPAAVLRCRCSRFFQRREVGAGSHEPKPWAASAGQLSRPIFTSRANRGPGNRPQTLRVPRPAATPSRWLQRGRSAGRSMGTRPRRPLTHLALLFSDSFRPVTRLSDHDPDGASGCLPAIGGGRFGFSKLTLSGGVPAGGGLAALSDLLRSACRAPRGAVD
jgi:hypothetical protein